MGKNAKYYRVHDYILYHYQYHPQGIAFVTKIRNKVIVFIVDIIVLQCKRLHLIRLADSLYSPIGIYTIIGDCNIRSTYVMESI